MADQLQILTDPVAPIKNYPGRKGGAGTWQKILAEIPKCSLFIDAMAGSGLIGSLLKDYGCQVIINDLDRSLIDKMRYAAANVSFQSEDYKLIISWYDNGHPERVFYFDPPYKMNTRSYQRPIYKHDWNDQDHKRFLKAVLAIQCPAIVSHYPDPQYDKALRKWRKISYRAMTRAGVRTENLWMNFPQPPLLQCYQVVGENFTDRQRIKRKVDRLMKRLENEPAQERAAILSSIIDKFSYAISRESSH